VAAGWWIDLLSQISRRVHGWCCSLL